MVRWITSSWTRSGLFVLACAGAACTRHAAATAPLPQRCAEGQARVREKRQDLAEGRLLRALAPVPLDAGGCPVEALELASITLAASVSLGDDTALQRSPAAPPDAPELFAPDGPIVRFRDATEAASGYHRAVAAYRAGQWDAAGKLGLAVGASGGSLAPEGFILAARSAEREGRTARAARMWARAYRAGCGAASPCVVEPPREDLFGQTAYLGHFESWYSASLCFQGSDSVVVNGNWIVSPSLGRPGEPRALDVREIPSRILLDRVDTADFRLVCLSRNGRHRFGVPRDGDGNSFQTGLLGEAWGGRKVVFRNLATAETMHVADDGRLIDVAGNYALDVERDGSTLLLPGDVQTQRAHMGSKALFLQYAPESDVAGRRRHGIARWDIGASTSKVIFESDVLPQELGPVDAQNRFVAAVGKSWVWMDGMTGKGLGEVTDTSTTLDTFQPRGVAQPGRVVLESRHGGAEEVWVMEIMTGRKERVAWLWRPTEDATETTRVLGDLPAGSSTWSRAQGWDVAPSMEWSRYATPKVRGAGRQTLEVVVAADKKGALVVDDAGRFEVIGKVPPLFLASASCRPRSTGSPPARATPTWPLEVCAAALEEPGLTAGWFATSSEQPAPSAPTTAPAPRR